MDYLEKECPLLTVQVKTHKIKMRELFGNNVARENINKFYYTLEGSDNGNEVELNEGFLDLKLDQKNEMVEDSTVYNKDFFRQMKDLTITGYFTSEIGATQALAYDPIPGKFNGCVPLEKDQKAWAL